MADVYPSFAVLVQHERPGVDFRVRAATAPGGPAALAALPFAILAPHGGGIEPGTSELAEAIAAGRDAFYAFEGIKPSGNARLHLTSTRFDEPRCRELIAGVDTVITLHGLSGAVTDSDAGERVHVGGLDVALAEAMMSTLRASGFDAQLPAASGLRGRESNNLCNRGRSGSGVQLELSRALRASMFESLTRAGRQRMTLEFERFVAAVRATLDGRRSVRPD